MKVKAKSFEAWKVIMITLVFLSYCVGMMPGEKAQAVYDKYLDNGIFGMAFFFVLVGFGIGIHYHKKFINLNKKNYLEFLGKKLGILYPLYMIMQTVFLILALCSHPGSQEIKTLIVKYIISIPMLQAMIPKAGYYMALNPVSWFVSAIFLIYLLAPVIGMLAARMKRDLKRSGLVIVGLIVVYIIVAGPLADAMVLKQDMPYLFLMNLILFCIGVWLANFRLNIRIETDRSAGRNLLTGAELVVLVAAVLIYLGTVGKYGIPTALLRLLLYVLIVMVFSYDGGMISHIFTLSPFGILSSMVFDFYLTQYFVIRYIGTPIQKRFGDSGKDIVISIILAYIINWCIVLVIKVIKKIYRKLRYRVSSFAGDLGTDGVVDDYLDDGYEEIDQTNINTEAYDRSRLDPMAVEITETEDE